MPRQLPWLNKGGGGSGTQVKKPPKSAAKTRAPSDSDDHFLDDTVLASSNIGKGKAVLNDDDSDDDLPEFPAEPSTPRSKTRNRDALRNKRAQSSSPPPIQDYIQLHIEPMRKGASRFDLRDDEWMMVEDEFLDTAKLFTRHLHIAEYDKLKERIEAKKNEEVEAARPVVQGAGMSVEGKTKEKAKAQEKRQRQAIPDVFASQSDDDNEGNEHDEVVGQPKAMSSYWPPTVPATKLLKQPPKQSTAHEPDSDDLDALRLPKRTNNGPTPTPIRHLGSASSRAPGQDSALRPHEESAGSTSIFAKPKIPTSIVKPRTAASRRNRATPFDMLDDYVPPIKLVPSQRERETKSQPSVRSSSPVKAAITSTDQMTDDVTDAWGNGGVRKETQERIARRKVEREKETERKRKAIGLDDIPTFLF